MIILPLRSLRFHAADHYGTGIKGGGHPGDEKNSAQEEINDGTGAITTGHAGVPGTGDPGVPGSRTNPVRGGEAEPESGQVPVAAVPGGSTGERSGTGGAK